MKLTILFVVVIGTILFWWLSGFLDLAQSLLNVFMGIGGNEVSPCVKGPVIQCAQCGDVIVAPEWSEHQSQRCVRDGLSEQEVVPSILI